MPFFNRRARSHRSADNPDPSSLIIPPDLIAGEKGIDPKRTPPLKTAVNFRDLGGYLTTDGHRVRWGKVYRSGALRNLSPDDLKQLTALGIQLICDLRSPKEIHDSPETIDTIPSEYVSLRVEDSAFARLRAILFDRRKLPELMIKFYTQIMIDQNPHVFMRLFERLAAVDNLPLIIRCTAGKDRTGIASAVLLAVLGVPEPTIIADYSLSNLAFEHYRVYTQAAVQPFGVLGIRAEDLYPLLVAQPSVLQATFDHIRAHYGTVETYLQHKAQVRPEWLHQVRENLLERV